MKRFAALLLGVAMLGSTAGCYCGPSGCWTPNYLGGAFGGGGYGGGYGGYGCPGGNCGVNAPGVQYGIPPQGAYQNYNSIQAGYPSTIPGPVAFGIAAPSGGVIQTAVAPLEPLPTF